MSNDVKEQLERIEHLEEAVRLIAISVKRGVVDTLPGAVELFLSPRIAPAESASNLTVGVDKATGNGGEASKGTIWISTKDKLPPPDSDIITFKRCDGCSTPHPVVEACRHYSPGSDGTNDFTHWIPMPEYPALRPADESAGARP